MLFERFRLKPPF